MILTSEKLVKVYGEKGTKMTKAVNQVEIQVSEGDFVGIMGPSGSGKTTLLNLLSGIDRPNAGHVHLNGKDITTIVGDELAIFRRENIGFVFQDFNLMDSLTVMENIMLPLVLAKKEAEYMESEAIKLMGEVGILKLKDKYPATLSGGEQQRVSICRGMINTPSILFADEPTGNLDSKSSKSIMETFHRLNTVKNMTMLMVTHDPFAASYCNRILFLVDGRLRLELNRGDMKQKEFVDKIVHSQTILMAGEEA